MSVPTALYSVAQVRSFDERAISTQGVSGHTLMKRAGDAALCVLRERWPQARRITVLCGAGNNGGDGYVLARLLRGVGLQVEVVALLPPAGLRGDARLAADEFLASGGSARDFDAASLGAADVIVDALLGTGFKLPMRSTFAAAIAAINATGRPVLALDLPSGLDGNSGRASAATVRAEATISFVALKQGLLLQDGPAFAGHLYCDALGIALPSGDEATPTLTRLDTFDITKALPPRERATHKGQLGRVLLVGGNAGMAGAVVLAGEACLRAGAGLVAVATLPAHSAALAAHRPELMCSGVVSADELLPLAQTADVIAIGPGLGQDAWARAMLATSLSSGRLLVLDADALNLVAAQASTVPANCVITPHPGEAARLLSTTTAQIQADRMGALRALVGRYGVTVVLKGAGSLLGAPARIPAICSEGNPGMAGAGMGDVLTGAIAGVLAQCRDPWLAVRAAVLAHGRAGDVLARRCGQRGLLAGDLATELTLQLNGVAT